MSVSRRRLSPLAATSGTAARAAPMLSDSRIGLMVHLPCPRGHLHGRCTRGGGPPTVETDRARCIGEQRRGYERSARTTASGWRAPPIKEDQAKEDQHE